MRSPGVLRSCCFNWRVWAGAGVVTLAVVVAAPGALGVVAPLVLGLACPLSMITMLWGMRSSRRRDSPSPLTEAARAQVAALEAEIAELRGAAAGSAGPAGDRVRPIAGRPETTPAR